MTTQLSKTPLALAIAAASQLLPTPHMVEGVDRSGNKTAQNVNDPALWQQCGANDAIREQGSAAQLSLIRAVLKDAAYPIWNAFSECYQAGAEREGYKNTAALLHRCVYKPLSEEGINKPVSPTSSNARPEAKAKADARKVAAEALAKVTDEALAEDLAKGKGDKAALYAEMARREKAKVAEATKADREARSAMRKSVVEIIDSMTIPEMKKAHALLAGLVAKRTKK